MGIRSHDKAPSLVCDHGALGIVLGTLAFRELIMENILSASDSIVRIVGAHVQPAHICWRGRGMTQWRLTLDSCSSPPSRIFSMTSSSFLVPKSLSLAPLDASS